ncbi:hypothetical protein JXR93_00655 [bacterium]|nr:hypothetical protein [bacterium]
MEYKKINDPKKTFRIAKAMASDIQMYHKEEIEEAIKNDTFFEVIEKDFRDGKQLLEERVDPEILAMDNYLERAIVDIILKYSGNIRSSIW